MKTNILVAIKNLIDFKENNILDIYKNAIDGSNRANNMGDALEYYIKDLFCNSLDIMDFDKKDLKYSEYLSYIGNNSNPPDFIIEGGPAIEVKKISKKSFPDIALNSSYPKDYLYSNSTLISKACKECENDTKPWTKKDMIYVVGNEFEGRVRVLWFIYGDCYSASEETYLKVKTKIKDGVKEIKGVEFDNETKELGKVFKIDPLGITNLRIRGMWNIKHPMKVFSSFTKDYDKSDSLYMYCLISKEKYDLLPEEDKNNLKEYIAKGILKQENVKIKNPNNPAKFLDAILFKTVL